MYQDKVHPGQAAHSAGSWVVIRNLVRLSLEVPSAESQLCPTGSLTRSELSHRELAGRRWPLGKRALAGIGGWTQ